METPDKGDESNKSKGEIPEDEQQAQQDLSPPPQPQEQVVEQSEEVTPDGAVGGTPQDGAIGGLPQPINPEQQVTPEERDEQSKVQTGARPKDSQVKPLEPEKTETKKEEPKKIDDIKEDPKKNRNGKETIHSPQSPKKPKLSQAMGGDETEESEIPENSLMKDPRFRKFAEDLEKRGDAAVNSYLQIILDGQERINNEVKEIRQDRERTEKLTKSLIEETKKLGKIDSNLSKKGKNPNLASEVTKTLKTRAPSQRKAAIDARRKITRQAIYEASVNSKTGEYRVHDTLTLSEEAKWIDICISHLPLDRVEQLLCECQDFPEWVILKLIERAEHIRKEGEKILKEAKDPGQRDTKIIELAKQVRVIDPQIPLLDLERKARNTLDEIDRKYAHLKTPEAKADAVMQMTNDQLEALLLDRENADHFMVRLAEAIESGYLQKAEGQDLGDLNSTKLQRMIDAWNMELEVYEMSVHEMWDYTAMDRINPLQKRVAKRVMEGPRATRLRKDIDMTAFSFSESKNTLEPKSMVVEPPTSENLPESSEQNQKSKSTNNTPMNPKVLEVIQNKTKENENLFGTQNSRNTTDNPTTQGSAMMSQRQPHVPIDRNQIYRDPTFEHPPPKVTTATVKEALTSQIEGEDQVSSENESEIQALRREMKRIQDEKNEELHEMQKLLKKQSDDIYIMRRNQENANARARSAGAERPPLQDIQVGTTENLHLSNLSINPHQ